MTGAAQIDGPDATALARVGLVERFVSSGDRRRRYVRLDRGPLSMLALPAVPIPSTALFVCTHNSARSQLAAALWRDRVGTDATSAGTHPADQVHPGAIAAALRRGLDLSTARPHVLDGFDPHVQVVTVCDRAHEELDPYESWWHWSIPDPVDAGPATSRSSFCLARWDRSASTVAGSRYTWRRLFAVFGGPDTR